MRVAIFTGPTGGHFFPAFAFSESLRTRHPEAQILFVTSHRGRSLAEKAKHQIESRFEFLPDFPFPRPPRWDFLIRLFPFLIKLSQSFWKVEKLLNEFRPDLCIGFGSYVAFPGILASRRKKIPTIIHEQNYTRGKANAWLARFATRIALSFNPEGTRLDLPRCQTTGLPLRSRVACAAKQKREKGLAISKENQFRILIVGGSQGAHVLNELWRNTWELFSDEEKSKLAVTHITGEKDFATLRTMYQNQQIETSLFPFHDRMEELYREADLAITRAGASTLFELAAFGLPAIVVPYPHAEGHQEENARYFEKRGGIRVLPEKNLAPQRLKDAVVEIMNSENLRNQMSHAFTRLALPDAGDQLVELCDEIFVEREPCAA